MAMGKKRARQQPLWIATGQLRIRGHIFYHWKKPFDCECRASTRARRKHATARGGRNGRIHCDCRLCGPAMAAHPVIKSEWNPELPPGTITAYRSRCGRFCFGHLPTQMQGQTFQGALLLAY